MSTTDLSASENAGVIAAFWEATERRDLDALVELVDPDVVMEWPQSGERFVGVRNALGALEAQDEPPEIAGEPRIIGCGDVYVSLVPLRYGETPYHYIGVFELAGGRVRHTTEYFAAPFPAKAARAAFAEGSA